MPALLTAPRLAAARRATAVAAASTLTVLVGVGLVLKAPYYGLPLPLMWLVIGVTAWLAITNRTGPALAVVLLYMGLLDGVVKLKSGGQAATLGRDVLLYAVAVGMAIRARRPFRMPPLGGWVVAWAVVVMVQMANPASHSGAHAVASLRQHLEFIPLFFIGFSVLRTHASLHGFFALTLAVAAINGPVAAYQGSLTPAQLASWGPGYGALVTGAAPRLFKGADGKPRIRPPGLGGDMGFGGILGAVALPGGIALLMTYRRRRSLLILIVVGIIAAAAGVFTSQSRSAVMTAAVALVSMLGLIAVGGQARRALIAVSVAVAMAGTAVIAIDSYDSSTFYRYDSIAPGRAASTTYDYRSATWASIPVYFREIPFGAGLGTVGPAADKLGGRPSTWNAESQFTFLIVETGIAGLVIFLAFQVALCWTVLRGLRRERDPHTVVLMAALTAPLFGFAANWLVGVNTTSPPNAPYLWFATGAVAWWLVVRRRALNVPVPSAPFGSTRVDGIRGRSPVPAGPFPTQSDG